MKNVFAKILVLVLCLTFVISGLASCKTDDQIADLQNQIDQNKNDDKADAAALEELKTLVEQIKNTADSAATAAALQEVITDLAAVKNTADAAATAAKLTEVETALKALVETNGANDATVKADLEAAIAAVKATAEAAATKAAFDAAVAELQNTIATEKAAFVAELATINASIAAGKTERDAIVAAAEALAAKVDANKSAVDTAIAGVQATIDANKTALEGAIADVVAAAATKTELADAITALKNATEADLEAAVEALEDKVEKVEADAATKAALTEAIDGVKKTAAENKAELAKAVADLTEAAATKTALADAVAELTTKIEKVEADAATKVALEAAVATINGKIADEKAALEAAINAVKTTADAAATKAALEAAVAANNTALATEVGKLEAKITETTAAIEAAKTAVKTELEGKITALETTLNTDIAALEAAVAANKAAAEAAIAAVKATAEAAATKAEFDKAVADLQAAIADTTAVDAALAALETKVNGNIDAAVATLAGTVAANKTALETEIAAVKATAEAAATKAELEAAIAALEVKVTGDVATAIAAVKTELEGKITALETKVDSAIASFTEQIVALQNKDTNLETLIANIAADIESLKANDFVDKYEAATKELYSGTYSKAAFDELVASIDPDYYAEDDYAEFKATADRLHFFLGRAISVDDIKAYFAELEALIASMPTLNESLRTLIDAIEVIRNDKATEEAMAKIKAVYDKIIANGLPVNTEEDPDLLDDYLLVTGAYDNLLAAVEAGAVVSATIKAIATPIVYEDSKAELDNANAEFATFEKDYFTDKAEYTVYYDVIAENLVAEYATLTAYNVRYEVLVAAVEARVDVIDVALNYNTVRPLYTDYEALVANTAAIAEWGAAYEIDEANYAKIYGEELTLLADAEAYALAMKNIYEKNKVAELCANIDALVAKQLVLYTDTATTNKYANDISKLEKAINKVANGANDNNFEAMIGGDRVSALMEVMKRQNELALAKKAIDKVNDEMVALLGNVDINSYDAIKGFRTKLDKIYATYSIGRFTMTGYITDANYEALAVVAEANYVELIKQYNDATAAVAAAYIAVRNRLDSVAWLLKDGKEIAGLVADLKGLIKMGVNNVNLIFESGDVEVNIPKLYDDYLTAATEYKAQATMAANAATAVNAAIADVLVTLNAKDVKDNAAIAEIYNAFVAWTEAYLAADIEATGSVADAIAAIQGIEIYGGDGATYAFVTVENYEAVTKEYTDSVANYAAAEAAWAAIKADMVALNTNYDIHSYQEAEVNFVAVKAAYDAYVATYYAGTTTYIIDVEEEATVIAFNTNMADCYMALQKAEAAANEIIDKIDNLDDITMANAADVLAEIEAIEALVEAYKAAYCDGLCNITEARYFALRKARAVAEVSIAYNDVYTAAAAEDQAKLDEGYLFFVDDCMKGAETDEELARFREMAESKLV